MEEEKDAQLLKNKMKYRVHMFPLQKKIFTNELPPNSKYYFTKNLNILATPKRNIGDTLSSLLKMKLNATEAKLKTSSSNKFLKRFSEDKEDDLPNSRSNFEYKSFVKSIFCRSKTQNLNETISIIKTPSSHFTFEASKIKMKTEEKINIIQPLETINSPAYVKNQPKVYFGSFKDFNIMNKKHRSLHFNGKKTDNLQNSDCSLGELMGSNDEDVLIEKNSKEGN